MKEEKKKKKKRKEKKATLSFAADEEDEEDATGASASATDSSAAPPPAKRVKTKVGKDPSVDTHFLPDRDREEADRRLRETLRQEWLKRQDDMKSESIEVTFSYWDGSGHRKEVECKKGDSIATFLDKARQCFDQIRTVSVDNLMYIVGHFEKYYPLLKSDYWSIQKEDLIIPHHYTFYEFVLLPSRPL